MANVGRVWGLYSEFTWGLVESEFYGSIQREMFHRWLCKSHIQEKLLGWGEEGEGGRDRH